MLKRLIPLNLVCLTLLSCEEQYVLNTIYIYDGYLSTSNDTINIPLERIIDGKYTFEVNNELIKTGNLLNSSNDGNWEYRLINDSNTVNLTVDWTRLIENGYSYSLPNYWKEVEANDTKKIITIDLKPNLERTSLNNNYLVIQTFKKEGKTLKSFNSYNINSIQDLFKINSHDYIKVELNDSIYGYYNRYVTSSGTQILNYNFETHDSVYELSFKADNDFDKTLNQLLFFEFIRSFNINSKPILPRKGKLDIELK